MTDKKFNPEEFCEDFCPGTAQFLEQMNYSLARPFKELWAIKVLVRVASTLSSDRFEEVRFCKIGEGISGIMERSLMSLEAGIVLWVADKRRTTEETKRIVALARGCEEEAYHHI